MINETFPAFSVNSFDEAMKKSIQILNEAAYGVCISFAALIALLLMLVHAAWKTSIQEALSPNFHQDFTRKEKDLVPYHGHPAK
jgi:hypothetical protein